MRSTTETLLYAEDTEEPGSGSVTVMPKRILYVSSVNRMAS